MHCIKQQYERVKNESSRMEYDNVDFTLIKKANTVLDAFAILTSNPPTIRKLLICSRYQFCNLLEGLDSAYSMITSTRKLIFSTLKKSTSSREIPLPSSDISTDNLGTVKSGSAEAGEVLIATETCLVACIEVFAQVCNGKLDFCELVSHETPFYLDGVCKFRAVATRCILRSDYRKILTNTIIIFSFHRQAA